MNSDPKSKSSMKKVFHKNFHVLERVEPGRGKRKKMFILDTWRPKQDIWLIGAAGEATQSIYETELKGPIGIVMGAEEDGLRRLTREHCDYLAHIPMNGHVESLNVSVATGIFLFEAVRQRA